MTDPLDLPEPRLRDDLKALLILLYGIVVVSLAPALKPLGLADEKLLRPVCWLVGHRWADEEPYGVEPVCTACNKRRQA